MLYYKTVPNYTRILIIAVVPDKRCCNKMKEAEVKQRGGAGDGCRYHEATA